MTAPVLERHREKAATVLDGLAWETMQAEERGETLKEVAVTRRAFIAAALAEAEAAAYERAAKAADGCPDQHWGPWCAAAIRALK